MWCTTSPDINLAIGYIGMISERADEKRVVMELIHISRRIYTVPRFKFYAIADGIFAVFAGCKRGVADLLRKKPKDPQLSLFRDVGFAWGWKNGVTQNMRGVDIAR